MRRFSLLAGGPREGNASATDVIVTESAYDMDDLKVQEKIGGKLKATMASPTVVPVRR